MKNSKYTLVLVALFMSTFSFAQFTAGVKTGLSISDAQTELYIDAVNQAPSSYTSFLIGGFVEIPINNIFSFQPELQFIDKGFNINEGTSFSVFDMDIPIGAKATTSLKYIEVPLLAKAKFGNGITNFYALAGPSLGYAVSAKIQPKVTLLIDFNLPEVAIDLSNDIYNRTEIAGVIGAGIEHNISRGKLFADLRYNHSFTNIINDPIIDLSIKNSSIQLAVGYAHTF